MFIHNIDPIIFSLGPIKIGWYGVIYALVFLLAFVTFPMILKIKPIKNFHKKDIGDYITYAIIGIVITARLFEVIFYNPMYYITSPLQIFAVWNGGMSFHGGLVGAIIVTWLFCKKRSIKFADMADMIAIHGALALFFGRIANFINGELLGKITDLPWCVKFQNAEGCRHPSQIYEAIKNLIIFITLLTFHKRKHKSGFIFALFVLMYGTLRFLIEFVKDSPVHFLNTGQWLCIPMIVVGGYFVYKLR